MSFCHIQPLDYLCRICNVEFIKIIVFYFKKYQRDNFFHKLIKFIDVFINYGNSRLTSFGLFPWRWSRSKQTLADDIFSSIF